MHFPVLTLVCLRAGSNAPEKLLRHCFHMLHWPMRVTESLLPGTPRAAQLVKTQAPAPPCPSSEARIDRHQSGEGFKGLPGCKREGWGAEGAGEPRFSYNRQIKSQGGGGFSRSFDLRAGEWKEEEAHLHRSSVWASSGRGSGLLAFCWMQGHAHTYTQLNKHGNEVQSRPTAENLIYRNLLLTLVFTSPSYLKH